MPLLSRFSYFYGQYGQYEISCAPPWPVAEKAVKERRRVKAVLVVRRDDQREKLERETGIEPATNGLGSRYSTIELLPLC